MYSAQRDFLTDLAQLSEKPIGRFGRPLWQAMSYHDTPEMRFVDRAARPGAKHAYRVLSVNSIGLKSSPAASAGTR